jgi:hypothetical protein
MSFATPADLVGHDTDRTNARGQGPQRTRQPSREGLPHTAPGHGLADGSTRSCPGSASVLGRLFAPHRVDETFDLLVEAQEIDPAEHELLAVARCQVAESDRKRAQHRAAHEASADPASWRE